jgi:CHAD domain-containing protein
MRVLARPGLLLRRRLNAIETQLPAAIAGDVEGIHQARVASRRLREILPLVAAAAGRHARRALRRDIRSITRRLGPLREIDVALETLAEMDTSAPAHAAAIALVRTRTALERERMHPKIGSALAKIQAGHLGRRIRDMVTVLNRTEQTARCGVGAAARLDSRMSRLNEAMGAVGAVYAPGPLHEVRIALKKFRYALEIAVEIGRFRLDASLKCVKSMQDVLGTMHDLQVLASRVRDCEASPRVPGGKRQLRLLAAELDERIRQLHSRYLDQRRTLEPVVGRAQRVAEALGSMSVYGKPEAGSKK